MSDVQKRETTGVRFRKARYGGRVGRKKFCEVNEGASRQSPASVEWLVVRASSRQHPVIRGEKKKE